MDKKRELKAAKRNASLLLAFAAAVFLATLFFPRGLWMDGLQAITEAAMVGALADWFAVVALFKRIPIPFISSHTAIIPNNKDRIGDNLAAFVKDKFLDASSLVDLIRKHDPARRIADWLSLPENSDRLATQATNLVGGILDFMNDARIQAFIKNSVHTIIDKVDLSGTTAMLLDSLTKDGKHQALLDQGINRLSRLLNKASTREFISQQIVDFLKREHSRLEKMLPSEMLGKEGAKLLSKAVNSLLDDIIDNRNHALRKRFDGVIQRLISQLRNDPQMLEKAAQIKSYLKNDTTLNIYIEKIWSDFRYWLKEDLASPDSVLRHKFFESGRWLGKALVEDGELRASLNMHMEKAARSMAPEVSNFLARHISDTVKSWDARTLSELVELNIGKDLQFIRINGTIVGGFIGLILYLLSHLPLLVDSISR